jgi:hypothetical protein
MVPNPRLGGVEGPTTTAVSTIGDTDWRDQMEISDIVSGQDARTLADGGAMNGAEEPKRDIGITTLLVGALTGQYELSEADRQTVGEWMVDHADEVEVRDLLTKIVRTQIGDTSEFRVKVAEAIRNKFRSAPLDVPTDQNP